MLAGHYAAAYALRAARPAVSLSALFIVVQAVDIVFFLFALIGIERLAVVPDQRGPLAMRLVSIPFTHSLAMNVVYAAVLIAAGVALKRAWAGVFLAAALLSHWLLDLFVHLRDLPLTLADETKAGFGLWRYPAFAFLLETTLVLVAYGALRRSLVKPEARRWAEISVVMLILTQTIYVFGPPPATVLQMAVSAEAIYVVMAVIAYQIDRRA